MEEIASSVIAFDVDNKNNDGWLVTARGQIIHARQSSNTCSRKEEKVPCQGAITGENRNLSKSLNLINQCIVTRAKLWEKNLVVQLTASLRL